MTTDVESFFDPRTFTLTHLVADPASGVCAVIDPVLDFDVASGRTAQDSIGKVISRIGERGLQLEWILETHVHADHLSAAPILKQTLGGRIGIGGNVRAVQETFIRIFDLAGELTADGSAFDKLFEDGETIEIGSLTGQAAWTPGHTPACVSYVFGDAAFVGDTLFAPDYGTARCDFPGGDAATLYRSLQRMLSWPDDTRLFFCHDYLPDGRQLRTHATVAEQRRENVHLAGKDQAGFVAQRHARDKNLSVPALIIPAVQVNIRGGLLPAPSASGRRFLKWPIDAF